MNVDVAPRLTRSPDSALGSTDAEPSDVRVSRADVALTGLVAAVSAAMATGLDAQHAPSLWLATGMWGVVTAILALARRRSLRHPTKQPGITGG